MQDVELLSLNSPSTKSDSIFAARRYLHHLGVAKTGAKVDMKKLYTDGNGTNDSWVRSSTMSHIADTLMSLCSVTRLEKQPPHTPSERLSIDDFDFTEETLSLALSRHMYSVNAAPAGMNKATQHRVAGINGIDDHAEGDDAASKEECNMQSIIED